MRAIPTSHTERIYVKVTSDFDSTGYMQPKSITWADGRTFPIDAVRDFRPAGAANNDFSGDCFTVLIQGQEKHLFFEHIRPALFRANRTMVCGKGCTINIETVFLGKEGALYGIQ